MGSMFDGSEFFADPAPKHQALEIAIELDSALKHKVSEIPKELDKPVANQKIANIDAAVTAKFESQVSSLDNEEKPVSLMNDPIESALDEAPRSNRVSFGSAWDGSIAKTLTVPGSDWTYESPENSIGKLLFKFTKIHSVTSGLASLDKNIEIEVTQGSQSQCSPIYILHTWQTELAVEWEPNLFLVPDIPLQIVLRIKDMPVETQQTLKRSNTTKQAIENIFSSRGRKSEDDPRMIKSNDSVSSFSSICSMRFGNSTAPIKQKTTIANFNICTPVEWSADFKNNAEQHQIAVFASDWDHKRKGLFGLSKQPGIQKVAILDAQILFLPARGSFQNEVLPCSITEYRDDLAIAQLHSKLWKEGYMSQLGGDCETWTRRYFKLVGNDLIAHHPTVILVKIVQGRTFRYKIREN